ncbi:MAG: hypothetical protein DBY17_06260 [Oscillospiraceae bacterium]|nr:MAG: hypothetical protein DBY17_06260 [Oscillospiraceae bacterium]
MEKQPQRPMMGALETQLSFEEAQSLCAMEDMPVEAFSFTGGGAPGAQLAKSEWRGCALKGVCLRGADLRGAYFRDVSFLNCDFADAALIGTTLHRCAFEGCRLTGANFSAGALADVRFFGCVAQSAVFSECGMKAVLFEQTDLSGAAFCDIGLRRRAAFAFKECSLAGAQFLHTPLAGHSFATCNIEGISLEGPELRGARVTALQACELAKLLGVIVE